MRPTPGHELGCEQKNFVFKRRKIHVAKKMEEKEKEKDPRNCKTFQEIGQNCAEL